MLRQTYAPATTCVITSYRCTTVAVTLPWTQSPKLQASKEKMVQNSKLKACIPANLQVGAYRAVVYTTKIMLALARVSKQQSQPFMVRVEINIAERRVPGGQAAPVVQHIYGCGSLTMSITAWYAGKHGLLSKLYVHCLGFFFASFYPAYTCMKCMSHLC